MERLLTYSASNISMARRRPASMGPAWFPNESTQPSIHISDTNSLALSLLTSL
jgi:hypothetical protein